METDMSARLNGLAVVGRGVALTDGRQRPIVSLYLEARAADNRLRNESRQIMFA
jgi:hypothetical protein